MGALTALGHSVDETWDNLVQGRSGVGPITLFDAHHLAVRIAAEVKNFNPEQHFSRKEARRMARCAQFAVVAARQAVADAGLTYPFDDTFAERCGVLLGTGMGGFDRAEQGIKTHLLEGLKKVNPFSLPASLPNLAAFHVCVELNAQGYSNTTATACAAGTIALAEAAEVIKRGRCDVMIAGGVEGALTETTIAGFIIMRALAARNEDPAGACRPFDATRDGFVAGEGAAIFVLERLDHALARGATIYAEILGSAHSSDTYHIAAPDPKTRGAIRAMQWALKDAGLSPEHIDYINAHGPGTPLGDAAETRAIKAVFGDRAYQIPVSSTKSMLGHSLGAAGAIEALACVKTIQTGIIHPTINYHHPDPECDLDYVPNQARRQRVDIVLSNSFGLGGQNSCLVLARPATDW
ncbi:MAG: beta-ketoacyl-[acyl-carrier-protein] synthase II [Chloroflexi bacterium]|nr:MAG: beta-ketoacyl-[acyl-carrier-protein] synthase II [Chloroflexota bacterium]